MSAMTKSTISLAVLMGILMILFISSPWAWAGVVATSAHDGSKSPDPSPSAVPSTNVSDREVLPEKDLKKMSF